MSIHTIRFYQGDPVDFGFTMSGSFTYSGQAAHDMEAVVTETQTGTGAATLEGSSGETATATLTRLDDGVVDNAGKRVSAVQSYTLRDTVTGESFEVIKLRVHGFGGLSGSGYTLSEQPLVPGRSYEVTAFESPPSLSAGDPVFTYADHVCLADGTLIDTPGGAVPVEALREGDLVLVAGPGTAPVVWIGRRTLALPPGPHRQKPVRLAAGCLGPGVPARDLVVSPQHRVLLVGPHGVEVLCPAKALLALPGVEVLGWRRVTYHALALPAHGIIRADGAAVESFWPGPQALRMLCRQDRARLEAVLPGIGREGGYGPPARPLLRVREAERLVARLRRSGPGQGRPGPATARAQPGTGGAAHTTCKLCAICHSETSRCASSFCHGPTSGHESAGIICENWR